jgi:hypothetical protein
MTEVLKALRVAGHAFGEANAELPELDFERALAFKITTIEAYLYGTGVEGEYLLRAFEQAAHAARIARKGKRCRQPDAGREG